MNRAKRLERADESKAAFNKRETGRARSARMKTMPRTRKNKDLHGSAPDKCEIALLLIDVINPLDFPEARQLMRFVPGLVRKLRQLKRRAQASGIPIIYVNDNFGRWRSDFRRQVEFCLREGSRSAELVTPLQPDKNDYFVLKPKHSGFFATTLDTLLRYLGTRRLILTGIAGNFCVLFTANDAYMRDYEIVVPSDCVISNTLPENRQALQLIRRFLKADIRRSDRIAFPRAKTKGRRRRSPAKKKPRRS
jgi:nicotinamidase-related amidase